jgi:hypothetical protein
MSANEEKIYIEPHEIHAERARIDAFLEEVRLQQSIELYTTILAVALFFAVCAFMAGRPRIWKHILAGTLGAWGAAIWISFYGYYMPIYTLVLVPKSTPVGIAAGALVGSILPIYRKLRGKREPTDVPNDAGDAEQDP